jgi:hypothetical protein
VLYTFDDRQHQWMQTIWRQMDRSNEILQDFPSLDLNVLLSQTAQVQSIAQALQQGILAQVLPSSWAEAWQQGLSHWSKQSVMLTAPISGLLLKDRLPNAQRCYSLSHRFAAPTEPLSARASKPYGHSYFKLKTCMF